MKLAVEVFFLITPSGPMINQKRLVYLITPVKLGYGFPQVLFLYDQFKNRGFLPIILCLSDLNLELKNYRQVEIQGNTGLKQYLYLLKLCLLNNPEHVIFTTWFPLSVIKLFRPKGRYTYYQLEIEEEMHPGKNPTPKILRKVINLLAIRLTDYLLSPQEDRLKLAKNKYPFCRGYYLVYNCQPLSPLKEGIIKSPVSKPTVLYSGQLTDWIEIDLLLNTIRSLYHRFKFVLVGECLDQKILGRIYKAQKEKQLLYLGYLPNSEISQYYHQAQIGLVLWKQFNQTTRFSAPNKLFEYISWGLPVVSTQLYSVAKWNQLYKFGIVLAHNDTMSLKSALISLSSPRSYAAFARHGSYLYKTQLNYEHQISQYFSYLSPFAENRGRKPGDECEEVSASEGFRSRPALPAGRRSSREKIPRSSNRRAS